MDGGGGASRSAHLVPSCGANCKSTLLAERRSASLLCWGSVIGILSIALSVAAVVERTKETTKDCIDEGHCSSDCFGGPCNSTHRYVTSTVSEMVSKTASPEGKIFQALACIASLLILMSGYPYNLSNVKCASYYIMGCRAGLVPLGMLLVVWIPIAAWEDRTTPVDHFVASVHNLGATLAMLGYVVLEFLTVHMVFERMSDLERECRVALGVLALVFMVAFIVAWKMAQHADGGDVFWDIRDACESLYGNVSDASASVRLDLFEQYYGRKVLMDSASGKALVLKYVSFLSQIGAGLTILMSHMLIWIFCKERHIEVTQIDARLVLWES